MHLIQDVSCLGYERYDMEDQTAPHGMTEAGQKGDAAEARAGVGPRTPRPAGRRSGRRPKLSGPQQAALVDEVLSGRRSAAQMARHYEVSEPTVSRILAAHRARAGTPAVGAERPPALDAGAGSGRVAGVLPAAVLEQRLAIVGTSGSGKTYAAKGMVEHLVEAGARVCIVDPLGVWWGLRLTADGTTPAPDPVVVFGGRHADIALAPGQGAALGRLVATRALACVVDVSDLGSASARRAFVTAFTEALHEANAEPLHLVLDEADLWAPQRVQLDGYDLLGRIEEIVRRGRVRGFVPWLITQRPAVLHKDVLSQADVLVSMKLTSSQDRAAVGRWIEGQADRAEGQRILAALPRLRQGQGWVWAPSDGVLARVAFPPIRSLDSSGTPPRRERPPALGLRPWVDVASLAAALAGGEDADAAGGNGGAKDAFAAGGSWQIMDLERQLRNREQELAAALARIAGLESALQAQVQQDEEGQREQA